MFDIVVEKEFKNQNSLLGVVLMVKNEKKRISVTLNSIKDIANSLIVYDTGSSDDTMDIITEFSKENKINLYMIQGEFVDFATSRNVLLEYADTVNVRYLLLLDCNDELQGKQGLVSFMKEMDQKNENAFLVCQQWFSGVSDKYYNIRLIKNKCGWRYRDPVHEWLKDTTVEGPNPRYPVERISDKYNIVIYQDRTQDDDKTGKRFKKDLQILLNEHEKNPENTRILFYLAQTCDSLKMYEEALKYSLERIKLEGFQEERFHSFMRCGSSTMALKRPFEESLGWFIKAFEHTARVEPLMRIADYYRFRALKEKTHTFWQLSFMFVNMACKLEYPNWCSLFVDKGMYDYYRWHVAGIVSFYVGEFSFGKESSIKALETGKNVSVDTEILKFYLEREKKLAHERVQLGAPTVPTDNKIILKKKNKK